MGGRPRADEAERLDVLPVRGHRGDRDVALRRLVAVHDLLAPVGPRPVAVEQPAECDVPEVGRPAPPLGPDRVALLVLVGSALHRCRRVHPADRLKECGHSLDAPVGDWSVFVISHLITPFACLRAYSDASASPPPVNWLIRKMTNSAGFTGAIPTSTMT